MYVHKHDKKHIDAMDDDRLREIIQRTPASDPQVSWARTQLRAREAARLPRATIRLPD